MVPPSTTPTLPSAQVRMVPFFSKVVLFYKLSIYRIAHVLTDYHNIENLAHLARERIPERLVSIIYSH